MGSDACIGAGVGRPTLNSGRRSASEATMHCNCTSKRLQLLIGVRKHLRCRGAARCPLRRRSRVALAAGGPS